MHYLFTLLVFAFLLFGCGNALPTNLNSSLIALHNNPHPQLSVLKAEVNSSPVKIDTTTDECAAQCATEATALALGALAVGLKGGIKEVQRTNEKLCKEACGYYNDFVKCARPLCKNTLKTEPDWDAVCSGVVFSINRIGLILISVLSMFVGCSCPKQL